MPEDDQVTKAVLAGLEVFRYYNNGNSEYPRELITGADKGLIIGIEDTYMTPVDIDYLHYLGWHLCRERKHWVHYV